MPYCFRTSMSDSNTWSLPSMANDWDEEVLPSSPVLLVFLARLSIGPSSAFLNAPSPLSESVIREPDGRRWSILTPNWSKPWKL